MKTDILTNNNYKAYFLLTLTALFWSGNFIVGKAASIYEIPPFSLNFYRWLLAWFIFLPFTFKELIEKKKYIRNLVFNYSKFLFRLCSFLLFENA